MTVFFTKIFKISTLCSLLACNCLAQSNNNFFTPSPNIDNNRLIPLVAGEGAFYVGSMVGLNVLWYKHYPHSAFHLFNDNKEWQQMDKLGHTLTAYTISRLTGTMYYWCGIKQLPAAAYGTSLGMAFQTNIEIFDGFSSAWGFSIGDMIANTAGASLFLAQESGWGDQRIGLKISWHRSQYAQYRPEELGYGAQQCLKDYNGQTYWLSIAIASFLPKSYKIPGWACVDFGYGAEGMIGANSNPAVHDSAGKELTFERYRKYFISLDVDLTKIPTKSGALKAALGAISFIKIPFPAIEYSRKKFRFHLLYF